MAEVGAFELALEAGIARQKDAATTAAEMTEATKEWTLAGVQAQINAIALAGALHLLELAQRGEFDALEVALQGYAAQISALNESKTATEAWIRIILIEAGVIDEGTEAVEANKAAKSSLTTVTRTLTAAQVAAAAATEILALQQRGEWDAANSLFAAYSNKIAKLLEAEGAHAALVTQLVTTKGETEKLTDATDDTRWAQERAAAQAIAYAAAQHLVALSNEGSVLEMIDYATAAKNQINALLGQSRAEESWVNWLLQGISIQRTSSRTLSTLADETEHTGGTIAATVESLTAREIAREIALRGLGFTTLRLAHITKSELQGALTGAIQLEHDLSVETERLLEEYSNITIAIDKLTQREVIRELALRSLGEGTAEFAHLTNDQLRTALQGLLLDAEALEAAIDAVNRAFGIGVQSAADLTANAALTELALRSLGMGTAELAHITDIELFQAWTRGRAAADALEERMDSLEDAFFGVEVAVGGLSRAQIINELLMRSWGQSSEELAHITIPELEAALWQQISLQQQINGFIENYKDGMFAAKRAVEELTQAELVREIALRSLGRGSEALAHLTDDQLSRALRTAIREGQQLEAAIKAVRKEYGLLNEDQDRRREQFRYTSLDQRLGGQQLPGTPGREPEVARALYPQLLDWYVSVELDGRQVGTAQAQRATLEGAQV